MIDLTSVEAEIFSNLQNEHERLKHARINLDYYEGNTLPYRWRPDPLSTDRLMERESNFMRRVVDVLTTPLYRTAPGRRVTGYPDITAFYNNILKRNGGFALWPRADALSLVNQVAAFQVAGTADPNNPIKIHLWDSSQFHVFTSDDDPSTPEAVVTIDCYGDKKRYRLWTADQTITYLAPKNPSEAGSIPVRTSVEENPYKVLPFSFVHFDFPLTEFWTSSPGTKLRHINQHIDYRLTTLADNIRYNGSPIGIIEGVRAEDTPPRRQKPGEYWSLNPLVNEVVDTSSSPKVYYLQPDLGYVDSDWLDLNNFIDHSLEGFGVPPAVVRLIQTVARSGESIKAEQGPVILWATQRRQAFACYEEDLAKVTLQVAAQHLENNGIDSGNIRDALDNFDLSLRWPDPWDWGTPGPARDNADLFAMQMGLTDPVMILMRRLNVTEAEALQHLEEVERHKQEYNAIKARYGNQVLQTDATYEPTRGATDGDADIEEYSGEEAAVEGDD